MERTQAMKRLWAKYGDTVGVTLTILAMLSILWLLPGCYTVSGVGKDLQMWSEAGAAAMSEGGD